MAHSKDPSGKWSLETGLGKCRAAHHCAAITQLMRDENAIYDCEMSARHYFRDFVFCDSGMIPWLLIAELFSCSCRLADLVAKQKVAFPFSGEINFTLPDPGAVIARVRAEYAPKALNVDEMDGLRFDLGDWRFNKRSSNTEPVVRLNVDARGYDDLVAPGVARLQAILTA